LLIYGNIYKEGILESVEDIQEGNSQNKEGMEDTLCKEEDKAYEVNIYENLNLPAFLLFSSYASLLHLD